MSIDGKRHGCRKVAAHRIVNGNEVTKLAVLTLEDGIVADCTPLQGEEPFTEWLGGEITLRSDSDGTLRAFHNGKELK
ncbi:MAG: hypothetical protein ACI4B3_07180 [Prevotella sp.]